MKKFSKDEQKALAVWAADCAERVLPFFEKAFPDDDRPRKAIEECRKWARTGVFKMKVIRKISLDAHAAAGKAKDNLAACFAARAAGQSVATAHVPEHAFGPAYYSLKLFALSADKSKFADEFKWQTMHLPEKLRGDWKEFQEKRFPKKLRDAIKESEDR